MALKYSTIVSIVYFCVNVVFVIGLGVYVYKNGAHDKLKSKSYFKDLWNQRKIFAPLIIHFYVWILYECIVNHIRNFASYNIYRTQQQILVSYIIGQN